MISMEAGMDTLEGRLGQAIRDLVAEVVEMELRRRAPAAPLPRCLPASVSELPQELHQQAQELGQRHAAQTWRKRPANRRELGAVLDLAALDAYRAAFAAARGGT